MRRAKVMIQASVGKLLRICINKLRFGEAGNDIFDAYKIVDFIFNWFCNGFSITFWPFVLIFSSWCTCVSKCASGFLILLKTWNFKTIESFPLLFAQILLYFWYSVTPFSHLRPPLAFLGCIPVLGPVFPVVLWLVHHEWCLIDLLS